MASRVALRNAYGPAEASIIAVMKVSIPIRLEITLESHCSKRHSRLPRQMGCRSIPE